MPDKYEPTEKQLKFFQESTSKSARIIGLQEAMKNPASSMDRQFELLLDEMFKSDDPEIKVEFSRVLMNIGFFEMMQLLNKAMIKQLLKKEDGGEGMKDVLKKILKEVEGAL